MKLTSPILSKSLTIHSFILLALVASLVGVYLTQLWRVGDTAHLVMSGLFFLAVASFVRENQTRFRFKRDRISVILGTLIIGFIFIQNLQTPQEGSDPFLRTMPFISGMGVSLIASGRQGLKIFWKELTILFFLGVPSVLISSLMDISPITANFSGFLLSILGLDVSVQDVYISLPTARIKVFEGCSGLEAMTYLLGLSVIAQLMLPVHRSKRFFVSGVAIFIGFIVNGVRVALLVVLAANYYKDAFNYWHDGEGSLVFGAISVVIFWAFYRGLLKREKSISQAS